MLEIVKSLKDRFGLIAIKCELEAEGVLREELTRMAEIAWKSGLDLYIKIGGCEAISDLLLCREYDADGIIAPMIESSFSVKKFKAAIDTIYLDCSQPPSYYINVESAQGMYNIEKIVSEGKTFLTGITIGRGDLAKSLNIETIAIDGKEMLSSINFLTKTIKGSGLKCTLGGKIRIGSIDFISKLSADLDCFETRNLVFQIGNTGSLSECIEQAITFELLCLENRNYHMQLLKNRNQSRMDLHNLKPLE